MDAAGGWAGQTLVTVPLSGLGPQPILWRWAEVDQFLSKSFSVLLCVLRAQSMLFGEAFRVDACWHFPGCRLLQLQVWAAWGEKMARALSTRRPLAPRSFFLPPFRVWSFYIMSRVWVIQFILEQHMFELHESIYMQIFSISTLENFFLKFVTIWKFANKPCNLEIPKKNFFSEKHLCQEYLKYV